MEENKRFAQLIEAKGVTRKFIAEKWDVNPQYITNLTNKKKLGLKPIYNIKKLWPDVNLNWLLFGQGSMFLRPYKDTSNIIEEPTSSYGNNDIASELASILKEELDKKNEEINRLLTIIENYVK